MKYPYWLRNKIKWLYDKVDEHFSLDERQQLMAYEELLRKKDTVIEALKEEIKDHASAFLILTDINSDLEKDFLALKKKMNDGILKIYWDNKINSLKKHYYFARRKSVNVLDFFNKNNSKVFALSGKDNDTKANNALKWVKYNVSYILDKDLHNENEWWQYANETLELKKGDCEDGAILMANIMIKSGIPPFRVRLNAGDVKGGGHAYVTYLREKDDKWYLLDWSYWYNESVNFKKKWVDAKKYFGIWWSWTNYAVYKKAKLDRKPIKNG